MLYAFVRLAALAFLRPYCRLERRGEEHVPCHGPALLVANHSSFLDPPLIAGATTRPLAFVAKAELFRVPLLGSLIRAVNAYPVGRGTGVAGAVRVSLRVLDRGGAVLVFPEGTRGPEGMLRPGKAGAGMLAVLSGAPVIPVYVRGSGRALRRGTWFPRPAKVTVTFGPALRFDGPTGPDSRKASYQAASRLMMAAIARLKEAGPVGPASPRPVALDEAGVGGASTSSKSNQGRNGQHGEA
jgi:1-acyl-sn-glycerol-3-phosphate acyltransferase